MLRPLLDLLDRTMHTLRGGTPHERAAEAAPDSRRTRGLLNALLENTTDIVFAKDLEGRYLMLNKAGARAIGRPIAEVLGHTARELLPADVAEPIMEEDGRVLEAGETRTVESLGRVDGADRVFLSTTGVIRDGAGRVSGLFGIARDITELKQRERERAELLESEQTARVNAEHSARALGDLLAVTDAALSRLDLDELLDNVVAKVEAVFHADTVALLMRPVGEDVLEVRAARGVVAQDEIGSRMPFSGTVARQVLERDRPLRVEDLSQVDDARPGLKAAGIRSLLLAPMRLGDRVAGVLHVGTLAPRRFDDNDARLLQLVADRVAQAVEHARLFEASQRAIRARDDMLAVISHDLGNPLNGILLNANLLDRRLDQDDRRPHSYVDRIRREADRMHHMVLDLLDTASLDAGSLPLDRGLWPAQSLLTEAVEMLAPLADDRSVILQSRAAEPGLMIDCDRQRALRVFSNLIGNAIKFTPEQGVVSISAERDGDEVRFAVDDTGPGVAEEDMQSVFDRYWQAPAGRSRGRGLGLYIAKGIVEAHGGIIWVERAPGGGARFLFTLPATPER